jgi:hypothetical protein
LKISKEGKSPKMNPADYLRTYRIPELEKIADTELKKLGDSLTIPVDIEEIVENFHDIDIDVQRGLKDNHHIWGIVGRDLDKDRFVILVDDTLLDSDHLRKIYKMTVAEEFAHIVLHREAIEQVVTVKDFKALHNHGSWHEHERNAKWLAAAILIPREHILSDTRVLYKKMVCAAGFGNPDAIKKKLAGVIADKYEVSVSAMTYRISNWPVDVWKKVDTAMKDHLEFLE